MTKEEITNGSKRIAEYMGFVYIPFSADLKDKGFKVAGWYKVEENKPDIQEVTQTSYKHGEEDKATVQKIKVDLTKFRYTTKNGWTLIGDKYYKYVCRTHGELRYWNSLDSLVPVIQKIEKEKDLHFELLYNGCTLYQKYDNPIESYNLPNWSNNIFKVIVEFLNSKK